MLRDHIRPELKYIGKEISIRTLIDAIHKFQLTDSDTILLNPMNFDDIVLEYRNTYDESITIPYLLLTVLVEEDRRNRGPKDRIGLLKNDLDADRTSHNAPENFSNIYEAYRCGWCGSILNESREELFGEERDRMIRYIEQSEFPVVKHLHGMCCPNEPYN